MGKPLRHILSRIKSGFYALLVPLILFVVGRFFYETLVVGIAGVVIKNRLYAFLAVIVLLYGVGIVANRAHLTSLLRNLANKFFASRGTPAGTEAIVELSEGVRIRGVISERFMLEEAEWCRIWYFTPSATILHFEVEAKRVTPTGRNAGAYLRYALGEKTNRISH
jgi:hypothetical protein